MTEPLDPTHSTRLMISGFWIADVVSEIPPEPTEVIVLLHGYSETGSGILRKLRPALPSGAAIVAPNGPFPIPERRPQGYRVGYSWYFYDPGKDEYLIDMEIAVSFVQGILEKLGLLHLPARLIGFSQGGYLAPFVAQKLNRVRQVIGIGCEFLADELSEKQSRDEAVRNSWRFDQIHGSEDSIVSLTSAKTSHEKLTSRGHQGEFHLIEGADHRITDEVRDRVKLLLGKAFS